MSESHIHEPSQTGRYSSIDGMMADHNRILSEKVTEQAVRFPRKVLREEHTETILVLPEKRTVEETVEETVRMRERVIEVAKPIVQETFVEVPDIEFVEKIVEVPETIFQEKITHVPRVEYQEKVIEVPKYITQERIVEVPQFVYQKVLVEKIVEVPEYKEEIVVKQVPIDEIVEVVVEKTKEVEVEKDYERLIPTPVEAVSEWNFSMPRLRARPRTIPLPIYVPRFKEVPVASAFMTEQEYAEATEMYEALKRIAANPSPSLAEIEKLAEMAKEREDYIRDEETESVMPIMEQKMKSELNDERILSSSSIGGGVAVGNGRVLSGMTGAIPVTTLKRIGSTVTGKQDCHCAIETQASTLFRRG